MVSKLVLKKLILDLMRADIPYSSLYKIVMKTNRQNYLSLMKTTKAEANNDQSI